MLSARGNADYSTIGDISLFVPCIDEVAGVQYLLEAFIFIVHYHSAITTGIFRPSPTPTASDHFIVGTVEHFNNNYNLRTRSSGLFKCGRR
jgi:hypothetical protein